MDFAEELWAVRQPLPHFRLKAGKRVTWRTQNTLTETERLVASASSADSPPTESEGSTGESGAGGVSSLSLSGKVMGELGRSKSIVSMIRFLVARPRPLPTRTIEMTSSDREEGACSGGLLRLPVVDRDGCGMVMMRLKRRSVDNQVPSLTGTRRTRPIPPNTNKFVERSEYPSIPRYCISRVSLCPSRSCGTTTVQTHNSFIHSQVIERERTLNQFQFSIEYKIAVEKV